MFIIIWQYRVKAGNEGAFESMYGPEGDWVKLFRSGAGYSHTLLLLESTNKRIYQTIDFWNSRDNYELFYSRNESKISSLDLLGEHLTSFEKLIGRFETVE